MIESCASFARLAAIAKALTLLIAAEALAGPVVRGFEVYSENCASCHGPSAEGAANWQVPDANGELPAPPHDGSGHTWRHADAEIYEMISDGWRDPFNLTDRLTMPAFRGKLTPEEMSAVIGYLKSLWTPDQRDFQAAKTSEQPGPMTPN